MDGEIGENLCFRYEKCNSQKRQEAYDYYKQHDPGNFDIWGYDNNTIIFLDTNVILNAYFLSKFERDSIVKFITINKNRIVIASRVDDEYQKHRLEFISGYNKQLEQLIKATKGIIDSCLKSLNGDTIDKIKGLAGNHVLKYDLLGEFKDLNKILEDVHKYHDSLQEQREYLVKSLQDFENRICCGILPNSANIAAMYMDDELLQAIAQCKILSPLSENELSFVKQKYDECSKIFEKKKNEVIGRYCFAFPGCGDKKKDEKEGRIKASDLVIYHEMLKYMNQSDTDVIFLTSDLKKGDWVPGQGHNEVFLHYIENQYCQTGHVAYVKSADELPLLFGKEPSQEDDESDNDEDNDTLKRTWTFLSFSSPLDTAKLDVAGVDSDASEEETSESVVVRNHKGFRMIDADRFMSELQTCSKWANEYGAGYVGKDYFIYGLLGRQKHFEFNQSRLVYKALLEAGKIRENIDEDGDKIIEIIE